jgi:hypothetical protein
MATIQTFKGVVRLTKAQLNTLINTGSLSDGTTTITYDPETTIYLTPQEQASTNDAGVILIATDQDVQTGTNTTKAVTPAQLKTATIGIGTVFNLKGTKATASELPESGNTIGDVWYVSSESVGYIWLNDGSIDKWEQLGLPIDLSGYVQYSDIINNLTSTASDKPLSALQGKNLNDMITSLMNELSDTQQDVADNMTDIANLQTADGQNVKITGNQSISGTKNFTGIFQISGKTISYDSSTDTFSI